jgi:hypothetical protein
MSCSPSLRSKPRGRLRPPAKWDADRIPIPAELAWLRGDYWRRLRLAAANKVRRRTINPCLHAKNCAQKGTVRDNAERNHAQRGRGSAA